MPSIRPNSMAEAIIRGMSAKINDRSYELRFHTASLLFLLVFSQSAIADDCHPKTTDGTPQFVVGYGSLMERESKRLSAPTSGPNHPIRVTGFQRAWNTRGGSGIGLSTIFLGVTEAKDAPMMIADRMNYCYIVASLNRYLRLFSGNGLHCNRFLPYWQMLLRQFVMIEPMAGQKNRKQQITGVAANDAATKIRSRAQCNATLRDLN